MRRITGSANIHENEASSKASGFRATIAELQVRCNEQSKRIDELERQLERERSEHEREREEQRTEQGHLQELLQQEKRLNEGILRGMLDEEFFFQVRNFLKMITNSGLVKETSNLKQALNSQSVFDQHCAILQIVRAFFGAAEVSKTKFTRKKKSFQSLCDRSRDDRRDLACKLGSVFIEPDVLTKPAFYEKWAEKQKVFTFEKTFAEKWMSDVVTKLRLRQRQYCWLLKKLKDIPDLNLPSIDRMKNMIRDKNKETRDRAGIVIQNSDLSKNRIESAHCTQIRASLNWWFGVIDKAVKDFAHASLKGKWEAYKRDLVEGRTKLVFKESADAALNFKRWSLVYSLQLVCNLFPMMSAKTLLPLVLVEANQARGVDLESAENLRAYVKTTVDAVRELRNSKLIIDCLGNQPIDVNFVSVFDAKFLFSLLQVKNFTCMYCSYDLRYRTKDTKQRLHIVEGLPKSDSLPVWDLEELEIMICVLHAIMRIAESYVRNLLREAAFLRGRKGRHLRQEIENELKQLGAYIKEDEKKQYARVKLDFKAVRSNCTRARTYFCPEHRSTATRTELWRSYSKEERG